MKRLCFTQNPLRSVALACLSLLATGIANDVQAGVVTITDLNPGDLMSITGIPVNTANGITVTETYGESTRIPYNSLNAILPDAGHLALVTPSHTYFDKLVTYSGMTQGQLFEFQFEITNNTPYGWKDYHFEIWNPSFTARQQAPWASPNPPLNLPTLASDQFTGLQIHPNVATFYSYPGSGETHEMGVVGTYTLRMELYSFNNTGDGSFGMRQVATVTPEPGSMAIFGIGSGLAMFVRRRRKQRMAANAS